MNVSFRQEYTTSLISSIDASEEDLSWFGIFLIIVHFIQINQKYFIASLLSVGEFFGALIGGYLGGKYGPKRTIQISCPVSALGWILMAVSPNLPLLIIGRMISGFGEVMGSATIPMLVAQGKD